MATQLEIDQLTVVYDENCELCRRCRDWLYSQETYLPVDFLPAGGIIAQRLYGDLPWLGEELVVVTPDGRFWVGPAAFVIALWSTKRYRQWSYRLAGPTLDSVAERFFYAVSHNRGRINAFLRPTPNSWCSLDESGSKRCQSISHRSQRSTAGDDDQWAPPGVTR